MRRAFFGAVGLALVCAGSSGAQERPEFAFPVACRLGGTCFVQQGVDRDPGPGFRAFDCGPLSYDGHTGTDIRLPDLEAMAQGVAVLAAADGVVRAIRDGVPDDGTAAAPAGQGCGNGVALTHPNGWETQYCHLMNGSVGVAPGDVIDAGTPLGRVGYSGRTEFPHLEFVVRHNGNIVDPFDPSDLGSCGLGARDLWQDEVAFPGGGLLSVGFSDAVPEFEAIKAGTADADALSAGGPALVFWANIFGGRAGDVVQLEIRAPAGTVFHRHEIEISRTQAQLFRASGRRISTELAPGRYSGTATLLRDGSVLSQRSGTVRIE